VYPRWLECPGWAIVAEASAFAAFLRRKNFAGSS
jgi:hypothetical protein